MNTAISEKLNDAALPSETVLIVGDEIVLEATEDAELEVFVSKVFE